MARTDGDGGIKNIDASGIYGRPAKRRQLWAGIAVSGPGDETEEDRGGWKLPVLICGGEKEVWVWRWRSGKMAGSG